MTRLKYIRTKSGFIVWPDTMYHIEYTHMAKLTQIEEVISAGFCTYVFSDKTDYKARFICHGRSESLQIESKQEDSHLMTEFFKTSSPI